MKVEGGRAEGETSDRAWGQIPLGERMTEAGRMRRVIVTPPNLAHCQLSDVRVCGCFGVCSALLHVNAAEAAGVWC